MSKWNSLDKAITIHLVPEEEYVRYEVEDTERDHQYPTHAHERKSSCRRTCVE